MTINTTSASPKVTLGPAKAVVAAIAGVAVAVGPVLTLALQDGAIDLNEGISLAVAVLVGLGVPGVGTYLTPTKVQIDQEAVKPQPSELFGE